MIIDDTCPICGKRFGRTSDHVYKIGDKYMCSYTCMRMGQKKKLESTHDVTKDKRRHKVGQKRIDECITNIVEQTRRAIGTGGDQRKHILNRRQKWLKELETALEEVDDLIEEEKNGENA